MLKRILIIGSGTMGRGLAELFLTHGCAIDLHNPRIESANQAATRIEQALARRGVDPGNRLNVLPRLETLSVYEADIVLEVAPESYPLKTTLWDRLGTCASPRALLASGTSSLSITRLARASGCDERFVGLHFFNPPTKMRLVEVVRGLNTSKATTARAVEFVQAIGRQPIVLRDSPGFAVNRILLLAINQAVALVESGVASAEQIDQCMELGCNHPMGPLKLADYIGLDVVVSILDAIRAETDERQYEPRPLLRRMINAGMLGKKSGRGFLRYDEQLAGETKQWTYNAQLFCNAD